MFTVMGRSTMSMAIFNSHYVDFEEGPHKKLQLGLIDPEIHGIWMNMDEYG